MAKKMVKAAEEGLCVNCGKSSNLKCASQQHKLCPKCKSATRCKECHGGRYLRAAKNNRSAGNLRALALGLSD